MGDRQMSHFLLKAHRVQSYVWPSWGQVGPSPCTQNTGTIRFESLVPITDVLSLVTCCVTLRKSLNLSGPWLPNESYFKRIPVRLHVCMYKTTFHIMNGKVF